MDKMRLFTRPTHILLVTLCVMLMQSAYLGTAKTTSSSNVQTSSEMPLSGNEKENGKDQNPTVESGGNYHDKVGELVDGKDSTDDHASSMTASGSDVQASSEIPLTGSEAPKIGSNSKVSTTGEQASSTIYPIEKEDFSQQSGRTRGQDPSSTVTFENWSSYHDNIDEIVDHVKSDMHSSSGSNFFVTEKAREHGPAIKGDDKVGISVFEEFHSERKTNFGEVNNGRKIDIKQRPWSVIIAVTKMNALINNYTDKMIDLNLTQSCTGSLVGERFVLTAAHCVDFKKLFTSSLIRPAELEIFVGRSSIIDSFTGGITLVPNENKNLFYHPNYTKTRYIENLQRFDFYSGELYNPDIAILKLDRSALEQPGDYIAKVIPLPQGPELDNDYFYGRECFATGAGRTEKGENGVLYDANMTLKDPLADISAWEKILQNTTEQELSKCQNTTNLEQELSKCLKKQFWHAVGQGAPTINYGDSGGPLACPGEDRRLVLAGVAHFGFDNPDDPAGDPLATIHYRTGPYVSWIKSVIGDDPAFKEANQRFFGPHVDPGQNVGRRPALGLPALALAVLLLLAVGTL